ncbi:TonB-dependent receptor domain-containing protein [Psychroserpens sp.]|uniref:TonB-dependent receptor domain-containing protein n=1 Tax=Psychroserpens sp. TaxID=2020870 RepID=UPI001AFD5AAD|nr:TonB-dependent receptor [Psychroserpens sp.]MBO6607117.1 TonB-dependent receptor plug domain-containing protein [Psychroserpens sp.]MBO6654263.1 TonB-dependent receptor plug domain-containing protein [Psychroserpens sp.]MBO6682451.1 TonB-dependent receptor plug domain-containing protein [Psychroserpens sp.]MBO6750889.1 TonB-dependent receptor plug domain-containing protein [Psychroserpens sp.]MBO6915682.1 TonB-dependent receptor plug domain-containing protein [Psychroserpens sp.]
MKKLIISILLIFPTLAFSQEEAKLFIGFNNEPVKEAFEQIETLFDVRFSYQDEVISNKVITLNKEKWTLTRLLAVMTSQTNLRFERIAERYIIVNNANEIAKLQQLERIVLNSYLANGISKQKNGSYKIRPNSLGVLPGLTEPDVLESIQLLPGVVSPNETATGLIVRGGKMDQNRLIWDGINIYHKGHLFGMISPFNPYATTSVEFINKGTNPRYGERASSVISMKTTDKIGRQVKAHIGFNAINTDAFVTIPILKNKLGIQASVRSSFTNLYQSFTFDQLVDKVFRSTRIGNFNNPDNEFNFLDYNVKLNYRPSEDHKLYASLNTIENDLDYNVSNVSTNESFNDVMSISNYGYGFGWQAKWSPSLKQNTKAFFTEYRFNYNFITSENDVQVSDFDKRNIIFDSGISTEFEKTINENTTVNLGYQFVLKDVAYAFVNTTDLQFILDQDKSVIRTHSLFANYEYRNPKLFDVSFGLRGSYFHELEAYRFEPRLLVYKPLFKNLKLQVSGEIKNQVISEIDETIISDLALENRLWRLANGSEFPIINSKQVSAGLIYTNNGWTIDIDNYYKTIDNVTALSFGFLNPINSQFNIGEQRIFGVDLFVKKRWNEFNSWISYSYNNSESRYDNLNADKFFTSRTNVRHMISSSLSYNIANFQVALGWRWQTGKPFTLSTPGPNGLEFNDGINTERLPDYHRLDISSTYKFKFSNSSKLRAKVGISLRNVYDRENLISREYLGNNDFSGEIEAIDRFSLGFTPNVMFRLYW